MNKQKQFNQICRDIKSIKIQGAENIAKKAFYAYKLIPTKESKQKLSSLRPTEPLLFNILKSADSISYIDLVNRLNEHQEIINKELFKIIKDNSVIFTHCHSTTIIKALIYAKNNGKKFEVYNTEARPLFQGRKTTKDLMNAGIKVTMFTDSAIKIALTKDQDKAEKTKPVSLILLGADAITKKGVINKIGSGLISEIAHDNKIPFYILADSWKYSKRPVTIEQRPSKEVWKNKKVIIKNTAFEFVLKENITRIISELGNLKFNDFIKRVKI